MSEQIVNIEINRRDYQNLVNQYGNEKLDKVIKATRTFTQKVQRDARQVLRRGENKKVNTGQLINSIKQQVNVYNGLVIGQVYSGVKYARFIHEGAKHEGDKVVPFFVSFKTAPSLRKWAMQKGVIYQKTKTGERSTGKVTLNRWYMTSKKTGKEYAVNLKYGGLYVMNKPTKFLEIPFEKYRGQYIQKVTNIMVGETL